VRKIQTQVISIVTVILIGITMFSMANATTPEENKAAGAAFLAENAKKTNIVTTASGLQYEILTPVTSPCITKEQPLTAKNLTVLTAAANPPHSL